MSVPPPRDVLIPIRTPPEIPVPLVDLRAAHEEIVAEVRSGFDRVLESSTFILGPEVEAFEKEFADFTGARYCVGLSSGTDALELALRAAGIGAGDEVLLPANTFIATALAVIRAGATPALVDCDPVHHLLDPADLEARFTSRTRAVLPVHLYGQCAPMEAIHDRLGGRNILVIEDCAQAQGATRLGRGAGTMSTAGATSFYPGKNLGAYGDAGAVVTDDERLAAEIRVLRNYGSTKKYEHPSVGFNCRLDALQAVVLRAKLARLYDWNHKRRLAASHYDRLLESVDGIRSVPTMDGNEHVHHLFVIEVLEGRRDEVLSELHGKGIGAGIHYPDPIHCTGAFAHLGYGPGDFPVSERASKSVLSLPLFPQITPEQQEWVIVCLEEALRG